ncbi:hypothetical protein BK125_17175 [Paenibacillus odorifer]|uniref:Core-binding (CB) domain-containing protein n=1 Tax=Paenibacillus odorifer TaxID=189426 RepID=A0ABX3GML3_9BACL|nr:hypothetical protein [Paenibacillus odorifer]OMC76785.1 hypothetical protein BK125_17175 [Paenibacillus odorifer]OMD33152.1 hypothetical protein BSO21_15735 [Paenibacillus odorifer]
MKEEQFMRFLEKDSSILSKEKAVNSRMSRARKVEKFFNVNLDDVVRSDEKMYQLLKRIHESKDTAGNLQNAVRKYYVFVNGEMFPSLLSYEKKTGRCF